MSELANKSNENLASAELLLKSNLHAPSVHCAYYSSLQKMTDILIEFYDYSSQKLSSESFKNKIGSHEYIINMTFQNMVNRTANYPESQALKRQMEDFKRKRVDSDYKECVIDSSKSGAAITLAKKINVKLAQVFNKAK